MVPPVSRFIGIKIRPFFTSYNTALTRQGDCELNATGTITSNRKTREEWFRDTLCLRSVPHLNYWASHPELTFPSLENTAAKGAGYTAINSIIQQVKKLKKCLKFVSPTSLTLGDTLWNAITNFIDTFKPLPHCETTKHSHFRADLLSSAQQDSELFWTRASNIRWLLLHEDMSAAGGPEEEDNSTVKRRVATVGKGLHNTEAQKPPAGEKRFHCPQPAPQQASKHTCLTTDHLTSFLKKTTAQLFQLTRS